MSIRNLLLMCTALFVAACGKESPSGPDGDNNGTPGVSGSIGSVAFNNPTWSLSYSAATAEYNFASLSAAGTGAGLILSGVTAPGTYPLTQTAAGFSSGFAYLAGDDIDYTTLFGPGAGNGSAVVTVATPTRLAGTASYTAYPPPGAGGTAKTVAIQFDITVNRTASIAEGAPGRAGVLVDAQRAQAAARQ
jgi:hypothetical protein